MAKNNTLQRYIFKISSSHIINSNYEINLTLDEARENDELIGISESQLIRYIDYLNHQENVSGEIERIKLELKQIKKNKNIAYSRPIIKRLYKELDKLIFKADIVDVFIEKNDHYRKIHKRGFKINGVKYCRLVGTPNGVKHNTIIFIRKDLHQAVSDFINNGRNMEKKFNPAKLEAYKALVCSSSFPVSQPNGVLVVHDVITHFKDTYIKLDDTTSDNPIETLEENSDVEINITDGCGMATPEIMEQWGKDLGEDYLLPGCVIRNAFCKGAVFPIDFRKYCADHNITLVKDVWGEWHDINKIDLVLTESMLKLWDSYSSIGDYLSNCEKYQYRFAITKNAEDKLENQRVSNYQFIQSYDFSDEDIDELIKNTVDEIKDIMSMDYRKTILYSNGVNLNDENTNYLTGVFSNALMIDPETINDPFIQSQINSMISKRIDRAKIAVLNIPANYSLVSGDLYMLCQNMIGLKAEGLLKAGEVYSQYWADRGIDKIATFRAPMTSHNNIRVLSVADNEELREFYKYVTTPTVFNGWDMCMPALNGMDCDGDCVINTSSEVLIRNTKNLPAILCIQRTAEKCIPNEEILMASNIKSFGNAVGAVTNKITAMFEVQAGFEKGSPEYIELDHRIKCGQLFQQNAIDKTKGIDAKPIPNTWISWIANKVTDDDSESVVKQKMFDRSIVSEDKPYFMRYIYPREAIQYKKYINDSEIKCKIKYKMSIAELEALENKTTEQKIFLDYYYKGIPMGMNPCVINRICWKVEDIFKDFKLNKAKDFDYTIYKSGIEYDKELYNKIYKLYKDYQLRMQAYEIKASSERIDPDKKAADFYRIKKDFIRSCYEICPSEKILCDIVLDICYQHGNKSKRFAWDICGNVIIDNLLEKNNYIISYPTKDPNGDIRFAGETFSMVTKDLKEMQNDSIK